MDLSVILAAHNEEAYLGEQLDALVRQECACEWEIIVVDNNSTDRTTEIVRRWADGARLRLVTAGERSDKSYAIGVGIAASAAPSLAFCDADDVVAEGWLAAIYAGLADHEVVTGPNELARLNPPWLAASRGFSAHDEIGTFYGLLPFLRGNNYGLRREVFDRIGPLSGGYFPVEDLEFSYRCHRNGIRIVGLPGAVVHYRYRASAKALWRQGWKYGKGRVRIARLMIDNGDPRPPRFGGWKSWARLVIELPRVVTRAGRARWLWIAGNRFGQLAGSVEYRTLML